MNNSRDFFQLNVDSCTLCGMWNPPRWTRAGVLQWDATGPMRKSGGDVKRMGNLMMFSRELEM